MITSRQNPKIQAVRRLLSDGRARQEEKAFIAEGVRLVEEAWQRGWPFSWVLYDETVSERGRALLGILCQAGVPVEQIAPDLMAYLSATETAQGLLAVLNLPETPKLPPTPRLLLILDDVREPGNVGTLLRSAAAAGVEAVLLSPGSADPWQPKVVRAGMGAHFRLPLLRAPLPELASQFSGIKWVLADIREAIPLWQADLRSPLALIVSNEAHGPSEWARKQAQERIYIPMPGQIESLNVAMAGSILLFEIVRQRWEGR
ncbi:MAG: TrmH family RNA methyltransferase [Anaerolineales bacterium]